MALPSGYRIEPIATDLTFPVGVTFDDTGAVFIVESGYSYGEVWTTPRLLRVEANGSVTPVATGSRNGSWNGVAFHQGAFYIAEGGEQEVVSEGSVGSSYRGHALVPVPGRQSQEGRNRCA